MTAFEKAYEKHWRLFGLSPSDRTRTDFLAGYLACAAEAERLCFEQEKECKHDNPCHAADADAISALREVDR